MSNESCHPKVDCYINRFNEIVHCPLHAAAPGLLAIIDRFVHLSSRLRLRSPTTAMEIQVWGELREHARAAIAAAEKEE